MPYILSFVQIGRIVEEIEVIASLGLVGGGSSIVTQTLSVYDLAALFRFRS